MSWNNEGTVWGGSGTTENDSTWGAGDTTADNSTWGNGDTVAADSGWVNGDQDGDNSGGTNGAGPGDVHGDDDRNAGGNRACFNCGEIGHNKADCPNPRVPNGPCRRCGEEGHWSRECPNAPPMQCKECQSTEHLVKDCPNRVCKNCGEPGHTISQCKGARKIDRSDLPEMTTEEAWAEIKRAAKERDVDDVKKAIQIYVKASPEITYAELERAFRDQDIPVWLIAIEKALASTLVNMDLQGNLGKKYTVTYRFQWNPPRPRDRELWPKNVEENLERLADAGEVVYGGLPKCINCGEVGHIAKRCSQDRVEQPNRFEITCFNCSETGHRLRDCPVPRVDKFACKNCGQSGHKAAECTEPRSAENVECRKCGETGHFSRDCPQGGASNACRNCGKDGYMARDCTEERNLALVQCRNCDEFGHMSKDCPKPRDMSRVKCNNCQQMGHYKSRCTNPPVSDEAGHGDDNGVVEDNTFDNANGSADNDGYAADDW
ncbi:hypothetical protein VTH82DRAFT_5888 [Thermothelomyces myriococcoides]